MKTKGKILSLFLALTLIAGLIPMNGIGAFATGGTLGGSGTADDPYQINDAEDLAAFRDLVNGGSTGICGKLMADINLNEGYTFNDDGTYTGGGTPTQWTPIGNNSKQFTGTFDGDGHKVSGVYINDESADYQGLFGYLYGSKATIKNLGVENSYIKGDQYVGGVVGYNKGTVENCYNAGVVSCTDRYVGGVVGYNDYGATVQNCYNTGAVSGSGRYVGGVVGYNFWSTVQNCYNTGTVSGEYCVGGVIGYGHGSDATVTNCYNTGAVSGTSDYAGGVVGRNLSGTVTNCYYLKGTAQKGVYGDDDSDTTAKALTIEQMTGTAAKANMAGFDFDNVWVAGKVGSAEWKYVGNVDETTGKHQSIGELPQLKVFEEKGFFHAEATGLQQDSEGTYLIYNKAQLETFRNIVNNTLTSDEYCYTANTAANGKLMADIDLNDGYEFGTEAPTDDSSLTQWTPISNDSTKFTGTFDGNGHKVSGVYINNESADNQGLFGYADTGAVIKNLGIENSYIKGYQYVGGVVGNNRGAVEDCYNTGAVSGTFMNVGGVVGNNGGTVENCHNAGEVSSLNNAVGGLVGSNRSGTVVSNCYNTGKVNGSGDYYGGVIGYNDGAVKSCYNTGAVSSTWNYVGGIAGYNNHHTFENCYNTGAVSGRERESAAWLDVTSAAK